MKGMLGVCFALLLVAVGAGVASAQPIQLQRCATDTLDSPTAEARLDWARRCALTPSHLPGGPASAYDSYNFGIPLKEYKEVTIGPTSRNSYVSDVNEFEINYTLLDKLYNSGLVSEFLDGSFYRWRRQIDRKKPRPLYPSFGSEEDLNSPTNLQLFPHPTNPNDCNLYMHANGTVPANYYYVIAFCEASCYTPEQRVLFPEGQLRIVDAVSQMKSHVMTVTPTSSLQQVDLEVSPTHSYTAEVRDSKHLIIDLQMASGGKLRVTTDHPVLNGEGRLVRAETLKVGDELLKQDGTPDPIVSATQSQHYGKVYNLRPDAPERLSHVLVAEGYLVGSSLFQNDEVGYINRRLLYKPPVAFIP